MKIKLLADLTINDQPYIEGQQLILSDVEAADQMIADGHAEALPEDALGGFSVV